jgi:hypothetical protein
LHRRASNACLATKKEKGTNNFGPTIAARSFVYGYLTSTTWSFASKKPATGFVDCIFCYEGTAVLHMHLILQPVFQLIGARQVRIYIPVASEEQHLFAI